MELTIIATVARDGTIGIDGRLPWDLPRERRHFHSTTRGCPVLIGRRAYENAVRRAGGPPPGRKNVVLTTDDSYQTPDSVDTCTSIPSAITTLRTLADDAAYIAGGETVYEAFISRASKLIISEIDAIYQGDAYFPPIRTNDWELVDAEPTNADLTVKTYLRRQ
jgi:dihydrofolate reductase